MPCPDCGYALVIRAKFTGKCSFSIHCEPCDKWQPFIGGNEFKLRPMIPTILLIIFAISLIVLGLTLRATPEYTQLPYETN